VIRTETAVYGQQSGGCSGADDDNAGRFVMAGKGRVLVVSQSNNILPHNIWL
jgi:hypothetical protein